MQCFVYRSRHRDDTFLYIAKKDDFSEIPEALLRVFGEPEYSFEFELTHERKLVKEDTQKVIKNMESRGFHLQMPPQNQEPV